MDPLSRKTVWVHAFNSAHISLASHTHTHTHTHTHILRTQACTWLTYYTALLINQLHTNLCRYRLKFFVKCNQNCLKNAGNPKDSRRRFQVWRWVDTESMLQLLLLTSIIIVFFHFFRLLCIPHWRSTGRPLPALKPCLSTTTPSTGEMSDPCHPTGMQWWEMVRLWKLAMQILCLLVKCIHLSRNIIMCMIPDTSPLIDRNMDVY